MIKKIIVRLNTINKVKEFVDYTNRFPEVKFNLHHGLYNIDGKSILGIFSLDITEEIELTISGDNKRLIEKITKEMNRFKA